MQNDLTPWRILVTDDEEQICRQLKELFEGEKIDGTDRSVEVTTTTDFDEAIQILGSQRIDLLILDVRQTDASAESNVEVGNRILEQIKKVRFVPVVFYTGLPRLVKEKASDLVKVVPKDAGIDAIIKAVRDVMATGV